MPCNSTTSDVNQALASPRGLAQTTPRIRNGCIAGAIQEGFVPHLLCGLFCFRGPALAALR
jgi:hypothetical protein